MISDKLITLRKKHGFSQQELADLLSITRQTISNWECGQGTPGLDKALELAKIYHISLDDLAGNDVDIIASPKKEKDMHVLKHLIGKEIRIDYSDLDLLLDTSMDISSNSKVKVLEVNDEWVRIEYARTKENSLFKKERIVKLIELSSINGFDFAEVCL